MTTVDDGGSGSFMGSVPQVVEIKTNFSSQLKPQLLSTEGISIPVYTIIKAV